MTAAAATHWLRLALVHGIGPVTGHQLVEHFGSIDGVWRAPRQQLAAIGGIGPQLLAAIDHSGAAEAAAIAESCRRHGIVLLCPDDPDYPARLKNTPDAPLVLFVRGDPVHLSHSPMLAVVGARRASREGQTVARRWCRHFSQQGIATASGMAYGIDAAAHAGTLEGDAPTLAVLGAGLLAGFSGDQQRRIDAICRHGCIISEFMPEVTARPEHFPRRNRIIAGLAQATLVVEANLRSGSLITARQAADYGRDVLAVPGSVMLDNHAGCHQLIRDGAILAESAEQVLRELGMGGGETPKKSYLPADATEAKILRALAGEQLHVDMLAETCGLTVPELSPILLALELQGVVERLPGSRYLLSVELRES